MAALHTQAYNEAQHGVGELADWAAAIAHVRHALEQLEAAKQLAPDKKD